jgi:hypothetical protein
VSKPVAVFLCDESGIMAKPWANAGVKCYCVDIRHSIRRPRVEGNIVYTWGDIRTFYPKLEAGEVIVFGAGFPPCTDVAVSGARDFRIKGTGRLRDALELFSACEMAFNWARCPYFIENPVGKFSDHMGSPDYTFQPWEYGDPWTKKTCLWTGNGFVMPPKTHTTPPQNTTQKIWLMPPGDDRAKERSKTPPGFAMAVFTANAPMILKGIAA